MAADRQLHGASGTSIDRVRFRSSTLWPAHAAPLHMIAVPAAAKNRYAGQLVVAWHGYRASGHRVMSFSLDSRGLPTRPASPT